jgi:methylated-DNA-[protein]-cysteine S-methyltransferase
MMREKDFERADAIDSLESPVGTLWIAATRKGVCAVSFRAPKRKSTQGEASPEARKILKHAASVLARYFAKGNDGFDEIPIDPEGTDFQLSVWNALRKIPHGETRSYGEIARQIGNPRAVRAVGLANGSNPVAIVVPCHRVIGANGTLTGYGGGLEKKNWLLKHEGALLL